MYNYIVQIISTVDSSLKQEIEIKDVQILVHEKYYEFMGQDKQTIACFPIDRTIVFRVKK
jgi:hypothetical protein